MTSERVTPAPVPRWTPEELHAHDVRALTRAVVNIHDYAFDIVGRVRAGRLEHARSGLEAIARQVADAQLLLDSLLRQQQQEVRGSAKG
jgi:hypothetical protein